MKLTWLVTVASLALMPPILATSLSGQTHKNEGDKLEQEIRKIDKAEAAAVLATDVPAIEKYWAEDFTVNAPNNQVLKGKKDAVNLVKAGILDYAAFDRKVEAVLVDGDTAILMGEETVKPKGKAPFAGQTVRRRFTNIWMKRDGEWQLTARQATIISKE
jgi:ketosteroid isomerase-like protein